MGAPLGNQNAAKGKRWAAAVERALARKVTGEAAPTDVSDTMRGVDAAADLFVAQMFADKDLGYFKELGDRLDGKPAQALTVGNDPDSGGEFVTRIVREIVRTQD